MRRPWIVAAGLLSLAACRQGTSNERGAAERRPVGDALSRSFTVPDREPAARTLAALRAVSHSEIEMATLVEPRASTSEVKEYAARILRQRTASGEQLARLARERSLDPGATPTDPLIRADEAVGRDAIDRLTQASGPELDALYLALEAPSAMRLSRLADQAEALARDQESTGILRRIAFEGRDAQARAFALTARECGGQRDLKPAPPPRALPTFEDPIRHAGPPHDAGLDAGALRPRSAGAPSLLGL